MAGLKLAPVDEDSPAIEIQGERATVGRLAGVDHIINDPSVSRQHAVFECQDGLWTVTDKGSANGTFLDERRITTAEVHDGQELRFGTKAFRVGIDWADMPTALIPASAVPPRPIAPRPVASVPALPPSRQPTPARPSATVRSPIPPRPIPPPPPAPMPPVAAEIAASYGTPTTEAPGFWREGKLSVFVKEARLPDLCVKCGAPAAVRLNRRLSWHNPLLYLLVPLGLILYAIVAAVVSKRAVVGIPLCEAHRKRRTVLTAVGVPLWIFALLFFVGVLGASEPLGSARVPLAWLAVVVFFGGVALTIVGRRLPVPRRIDDHFVWLGGVHESVLDRFPPWPGPTAAFVGLASSGGLPEGEPAQDRPRRMATAAMIAGCLSIFAYPAPVAVVLGILGILDVTRAPGRVGMGRSVFGLVAGLLGSFVLGVVIVTSVVDDAGRTSARPVATAPAARSVVIQSKDGALRITAPSGWRSETDLNKIAVLQACDPPQQVCVIVIEEDRKTVGDVTLARFSRVARGLVLKRLGNSSENAGVSLQIAGHAALQYELRGRTDPVDFVYLHTSIETPGHFYQVTGWTSADLFPQEKAVISGITASFKPAAGR